MSTPVPDEPVVATTMFSEPEQAAWDAAVHRGLSIEAADVRAILAAAAPVIQAAERERLATVISPASIRKLADWFDTDDEFKETMFPETWIPGTRRDDVQRDLRRFAALLDGSETLSDAPDSARQLPVPETRPQPLSVDPDAIQTETTP